MKLFLIILMVFFYKIYAIDSLSMHYVHAEYCFQKNAGDIKLKLSKEIQKIKPISIAKTDSVECESSNCSFGKVKTSFKIPGFVPVLVLWGCASSSFRSVIKTTYDSLTGKIHCTTEYIFDDVMEKYSSLINIEFPDEKNFFLGNKEKLTPEDIQKFVGKDFLAEWETHIECKPVIDTVYFGKYFIRITGECPK